MFNAKLTSLKILNVPCNFWFSRVVVQNLLKTQRKCKLCLEKCSNCNKSAHLNQSINESITIPMWFPLLVLTFSPTGCLASSVDRKEYLGLKLAQTCCSESILLVLGEPHCCFSYSGLITAVVTQSQLLFVVLWELPGHFTLAHLWVLFILRDSFRDSHSTPRDSVSHRYL